MRTMVIFHPLVKVIISPNLLFRSAITSADWLGNARLDPGKPLWSHKINYPTFRGLPSQFQIISQKSLGNFV